MSSAELIVYFAKALIDLSWRSRRGAKTEFRMISISVSRFRTYSDIRQQQRCHLSSSMSQRTDPGFEPPYPSVWASATTRSLLAAVRNHLLKVVTLTLASSGHLIRAADQNRSSHQTSLRKRVRTCSCLKRSG